MHDERGRPRPRVAVRGVIDRWEQALPLETVLARLEQAGVPASRIYSAADMFSDPHAAKPAAAGQQGAQNGTTPSGSPGSRPQA